MGIVGKKLNIFAFATGSFFYRFWKTNIYLQCTYIVWTFVVVIVWLLDLQLHMQSVPITL